MRKTGDKQMDAPQTERIEKRAVEDMASRSEQKRLKFQRVGKTSCKGCGNKCKCA